MSDIFIFLKLDLDYLKKSSKPINFSLKIKKK